MSTFIYDLAATNSEDFYSGSIDALYYDREGQRLGVEFLSAATVYVYDNVAESTYNLFKSAPSLNAFYRNHIQQSRVHGETYPAAAEREGATTPNPRVNGDADHADQNAWAVQEPPLADWERELLEAAGNEPAPVEWTDSSNKPVETISPSKFGVKWTGSFNQSDERMGPFEFLVEEFSADAAIRAFWKTAKSLHGDSVTAKIVSVTHYFE